MKPPALFYIQLILGRALIRKKKFSDPLRGSLAGRSAMRGSTFPLLVVVLLIPAVLAVTWLMVEAQSQSVPVKPLQIPTKPQFPPQPAPIPAKPLSPHTGEQGQPSVPSPGPVYHPSPPRLPDLMIDRMDFGLWECLYLSVKNIGLAPKPSGVPVEYRVDMNYQNPLNTWTISGQFEELGPLEIAVQEAREVEICDRTKLNAYRTGTISVTLNPNGTLQEIDRTNNTRSIAVPRLSGPNLVILTGQLSMTGPRDYDSVEGIVTLANVGTAPTAAPYQVTIYLDPRWDLGSARPFFTEFTTNRLGYDPVAPQAQLVLQMPFLRLRRSTLWPNFFGCVAAYAGLDSGGEPALIWIWPPEWAGKRNSSGLPIHDPSVTHCWEFIPAPMPRPRE